MKPQSIKILSTNISTEKGTIKKPVNSIELNNHGVKDLFGCSHNFFSKFHGFP